MLLTHSFSTAVTTCLPVVLACHVRVEIMSRSYGEEGEADAAEAEVKCGGEEDLLQQT